MSIKPHICGSNKTVFPENGCSDCSELAYRLDKIEAWIDDPIGDDLLDSLTPLECYQPPCTEPIVCQTTVCCAVVACETQSSTASE